MKAFVILHRKSLSGFGEQIRTACFIQSVWSVGLSVYQHDYSKRYEPVFMNLGGQVDPRKIHYMLVVIRIQDFSPLRDTGLCNILANFS